MNETKPKLKELCESVGIIPGEPRPASGKDWGKGARTWQTTLTYSGQGKINMRPFGATMSVEFTQGSAHKKAPTSYDVLYCLVSDVSSVDNARDFEDWANEFGYDSDSRKALDMYLAIQKQGKELRALLGEDFDTFMEAELD